MTYRDRTFCGSLECENRCGRKLSKKDEEYLKRHFEEEGWYIPVTFALFCEQIAGYYDVAGNKEGD